MDEKHENKQEIIGTNGEKELWERLPEWVKCPSCKKEGQAHQVFTKRGLSYRCKSCSWDSHQIEDFGYHRRRVIEAAHKLKDMFPTLLFVENIPINSDPLTGEVGEQHMRYDFSIYWFGKKLERCRVSVVQNVTTERYLQTEEQYLVGIKDTVDYLSKKNRDALLVFYFRDEKEESKRIGVASFRELKPHFVEVKDRFDHEQYNVPPEVRKMLIKFGKEEIGQLVYRNFHKVVTEGRFII